MARRWWRETGTVVLLFVGMGAVPAVAGTPLLRLLRELREVRESYYEYREEAARRLDAARSTVSVLERKVEDLLEEERKLDSHIHSMRKEISALEKERRLLVSRRERVRKEIGKFVETMKGMILCGIPYNQGERVGLLDAVGDRGVPLSDAVRMIWSFFREELHFARSSETYTDVVDLPDGRRKHARILRVGKVFLGFVTEDGEDVGIWIKGRGWVTDLLPGEKEGIRRGVEVLDRKRAPEWVLLPVPLRNAGK